MPRPRPPSRPLCLAHIREETGGAILVLTMKPATDDPRPRVPALPGRPLRIEELLLGSRRGQETCRRRRDGAEASRRSPYAASRPCSSTRLSPRRLERAQVVHHLADAIQNANARFRLALTEDEPTIKPYRRERLDRARRRERVDRALAARGLRRRDDAPRDHSLKSLGPKDWSRRFYHPSRSVTGALDQHLALTALAPRAPRRAHQLPALAGRVEGLNPSVPEVIAGLPWRWMSSAHSGWLCLVLASRNCLLVGLRWKSASTRGSSDPRRASCSGRRSERVLDRRRWLHLAVLALHGARGRGYGVLGPGHSRGRGRRVHARNSSPRGRRADGVRGGRQVR